jgi:hypothetical protein
VIRRNSISNAIPESGRPARWPGKTNPPVRPASISRKMASARSDRGTRCSRAVLVRAGGTVQILPSKSISSQRAASASPDRAAVKMQNSRARAAVAGRSQREAPHDRALRRAFKLRGRLEGRGGVGDYIAKPKWMRWPTYERKLEEVAAAEEVVDAHLLAFVQKLDRRLGR